MEMARTNQELGQVDLSTPPFVRWFDLSWNWSLQNPENGRDGDSLLLYKPRLSEGGLTKFKNE